MKIVICGSMQFAQEMLQTKEYLQCRGHVCIVPYGSEEFAKGELSHGGYRESARRKIENNLIRRHAGEIKQTDAVLVLNYAKDGIDGYIGGNAFLEMGFAHILKKPIFLLHNLPDMPLMRAELEAMQPIVLNGNLDAMPYHICDHRSVGQLILKERKLLLIERRNYPQAFALPAGHIDGKGVYNAIISEVKEETNIIISMPGNVRVFHERINNPCRRMGGNHHIWTVFSYENWSGKPKAGGDAKRIRWVSPETLGRIAKRTEYFMEKYGIPDTEIGELTTAIFGTPNKPDTDQEWQEAMGLEPVWYCILKRLGLTGQS